MLARILAQVLDLAAIASLGPLALQGRIETARLPDMHGWDNQRVMITGHVVRDGVLNFARQSPQQNEQSQSLDIETESVQAADDAGNAVPLVTGVRVTV